MSESKKNNSGSPGFFSSSKTGEDIATRFMQKYEQKKRRKTEEENEPLCSSYVFVSEECDFLKADENLNELTSNIKEKNWEKAQEILRDKSKFSLSETKSLDELNKKEEEEKYSAFLVQFINNMSGETDFSCRLDLIEAMLARNIFNKHFFAKNPDGSYPILDAVVGSNQTAIVDKLWEKFHANQKKYLLHHAIKSNNVLMLEHLFKKCNPNVQEGLDWAIRESNILTIKAYLNLLDPKIHYTVLKSSINNMWTLAEIIGKEKANQIQLLLLKKILGLSLDCASNTKNAFDFAMQNLDDLTRVAKEDSHDITSSLVGLEMQDLKEKKAEVNKCLSKWIAVAAQSEGTGEENNSIFANMLKTLSELSQHQNNNPGENKDASGVSAPMIIPIITHGLSVNINKLDEKKENENQNRVLKITKGLLENELLQHWENKQFVKRLIALTEAYHEMSGLIVKKQLGHSPNPNQFLLAYEKILAKAEALPDAKQRAKWKKLAFYWLLPALLIASGILFVSVPLFAAKLMAVTGYSLTVSISYFIVPIYSFIVATGYPTLKYYLEQEKMLDDPLLRNARVLYNTNV